METTKKITREEKFARFIFSYQGAICLIVFLIGGITITILSQSKEARIEENYVRLISIDSTTGTAKTKNGDTVTFEVPHAVAFFVHENASKIKFIDFPIKQNPESREWLYWPNYYNWGRTDYNSPYNIELKNDSVAKHTSTRGFASVKNKHSVITP